MVRGSRADTTLARLSAKRVRFFTTGSGKLSAPMP